MRITVKKKEKKNYKSVKLVVFVLVFILLVNTVPGTVDEQREISGQTQKNLFVPDKTLRKKEKGVKNHEEYFNSG